MTQPGPEALLQLHFALAPARILTVAAQLGVFTHIAQGKRTAAAVAAACAASERGVRMILDALVGVQFLTKDAGGYGLTPLASRYLVRTSPDYVGYMVESDHQWHSWTRLAEAVKTGKPLARVEEKAGAEEFFPQLIQSLHVVNREPARRAAVALGKMGAVLDVACGSGVWSIPFAEAGAKVTALDFPGVLEHTRRYVAGLGPRYEWLPGDLKSTDLGSDRYDLAILGNIVHSEGEKSSRDLFARLARALRKGGKVAIVDMVPNDARTGPPFPLFFALQMLLYTEEGDVYTLADYRRWLEAAGFTKVETVDIGSHSPLVVATRG